MRESGRNANPSLLRTFKRKAKGRSEKLRASLMTAAHKIALNRVRLSQNARRKSRKLEIGPGPQPIAGFEALNIIWTPGTDYVMRATEKMPFEDASFETIYASHVLEHVPWYLVEGVLREWNRILKPGGQLEIWVPDGYRVAKSLVEAEDNGAVDFHQDGWWKFNECKDSAVWANGRFFSYGDGVGTAGHFNWHLGMFTERYLKSLLVSAGFSDARRMSNDEVRGYDHGWINMGIAGLK